MRLPTASVACFIIYLQQVNARATDKDQYARDLRSLYRKSQFEEFGGRDWQYILLALGDVNEDMVTIVNTIVQERIAQSLLQKRGARAVPRCQRTQQEVQGINHRVSEAKLARSHAKQLDKIVTKETAQYQQGESKMSWADWNKLLKDQQAVASTTLLLILLHPYFLLLRFLIYDTAIGPLRSLFVLLLFVLETCTSSIAIGMFTTYACYYNYCSYYKHGYFYNYH